jgi:hypothetical protein
LGFERQMAQREDLRLPCGPSERELPGQLLAPFAVVLIAAVLADLAAPASLALAPVLVDAVWLAETLAAALVTALARNCSSMAAPASNQDPRGQSINGRREGGNRQASRPAGPWAVAHLSPRFYGPPRGLIGVLAYI